MFTQDQDNAVLSPHRQMALARWDAEGGACAEGPQVSSQHTTAHVDGTASVDAEIGRMRVRLIALENLTIALLADAPSGQLGRQTAGATGVGNVTYALVGIAGSFIGLHLAVIVGLLPTPLMQYLRPCPPI